MPDAEHPREAARNDYVDDRLGPRERAALEAHLAACERCAREVETLQILRTILATESERASERDPAFEERLRRALDREDASVRAIPARAPLRRRRRLVAAASAAAALLALLWLVRSIEPAGRDLARSVFAEAEAVSAGRTALALETSDPARLARFHHEHGIAFPSRVLDLAMMGWMLAGGSVGSLDGRPAALALYRDAGGRWLVCRMFEGDLSELPAPARRFEASGFTFHVHRAGSATAVFWREGPILCVLVSDLPEAEVRALAIAKAMLPG